jgi:nucleotidyltransferase/DNA polymerase involved in DNA repair
MADLARFLDKAFEEKSFEELADAPVDALAGISKSDAEALTKALGIKTIRQLADHKVIRTAQALVALAGPAK